MSIYVGQSEDHLTVLAFDPEGVNNLLNHSGCSSYPDVLVAHWTVLLKDEPIFNASLAEKLITIIALFCIFSNLYNKAV